jgi:hypothetical protein
MLTGTPKRTRPLRRPMHRRKDYIRMSVKEICMNMRNWVDSTQGTGYWRALVNSALNFWVP